MKINIEMEAWELAAVIKGLTISDQPEEKEPSGAEQIKPILSDKTREKLSQQEHEENMEKFRKLLRERLKIDEILNESKHREDNPNPNYRPPMGGSHQ